MKLEEALPLARKGKKITCNLLSRMEIECGIDLTHAAFSFDRKDKVFRIYRKYSDRKRWEAGSEWYSIPARWLNEDWKVVE